MKALLDESVGRSRQEIGRGRGLKEIDQESKREIEEDIGKGADRENGKDNEDSSQEHSRARTVQTRDGK